MAFSAGVFTRLYNWVTEQASSPIEIAKLDTQEEDFATAFNNCILRDGTGVPTANTPWNSKRITGLADPSSAQDAATKAYVDTSGSFTAGTTGFAATAPAPTCYYAKAGNLVVLYIPTFSGTSNATSFTITSVPSAIQPIRAQTHDVIDYGITDNSATLTRASGSYISCTVSGSSVTLYKNNSAFGFTNSGTKGVAVAFPLVYLLN